MSHRPQLTVRLRLTLLYVSLFAVCGAIVIAVSYILVAQLGAPGLGQRPPSRNGIPSAISSQCRAEQPGPHPDKLLIAQCIFQLLGAEQQRDLTLSHLLQYSLIAVAVVLLLAAILGWVLAGRALRPLHLITATARAASQHDLSARVALRGPHDELRELGDTFNQMLAQLESTFASQQRFIANASHELRTPLAVMRATVDVAASTPELSPNDLQAVTADIREALDHAENLISALLILARNEPGLTTREQVDLATVVEDVLDTSSTGDCQVHATLHPAPISGDPLLAERLVANLLDNAVRYNVADGQVWIDTRTTSESSLLCVANTGRVINETDAERILEPFQRLEARTSYDGFGLGLTIVASIAAIHGGTIVTQPRIDGGLAVTVTIPLHPLPDKTYLPRESPPCDPPNLTTAPPSTPTHIPGECPDACVGI